MVCREKGSGAEWTKDTVPVGIDHKILFSRAIAGGDDGNTIHCIGVTASKSDFGGVQYRGMDAALLYWRSKEGGKTWDIQDSLLPQLGPDKYSYIAFDKYSIAAQGNTIAIEVWGSWHDAFILKSTNNVGSWTETTIIDFPVDLWNPGKGIWDPDSNSVADTLLTCDGAGDMTIDRNGKEHVVFGKVRLFDNNATEGNFEAGYVKAADDEVLYWNESFPADSFPVVTGIVDAGGSGSIDLVGAGGYNVAGASQPLIAAAENGDLYVVCSGLSEEFNDGSKNYRHIYAIKSTDNGLTWCYPNDLTAGEDEAEQEHAYPYLAKRVTDKLHVVYQRDFAIGVHTVGDGHAAGENSMVYMAIDL